MKIVLASKSPWRKKLLSWIDLPFEVVVSDFDEKSVVDNDPKELVKVLAERKSEVVAEKMPRGIVIGADTVIVLDGEVIGKPKNIDDAREILKKLRDREHFVYTGVCVLDVGGGKKIVELDETRMVFGNFSDEDLEEYLDTRDSLGKAGAYQFLRIVDKFVSDFDGSVSGVIGLPIKRLVGMLGGVGVEVRGDVEENMLDKIGYRD